MLSYHIIIFLNSFPQCLLGQSRLWLWTVADRSMVAGKVLPYSVKSGPWESVGGEWMRVPMVLVVMMGGSRIGVHIDTRVHAMPQMQPSSRE